MKPNIHPTYKEVKVTCSCGSVFMTRSTMEKDSLLLEVCAACHPFYTGTQKIVDTAGRVDRFRQKYGMKKAEVTAEVKEAAPKAEEKKAEAKAPKADAKKAAKKSEDK